MEAVKTTLGPRGMDKLIVDSNGKDTELQVMDEHGIFVFLSTAKAIFFYISGWYCHNECMFCESSRPMHKWYCRGHLI